MKQRALRKLEHAFEHLRPEMSGDAIRGILPNSQAQAGSILAVAMVDVVRSAR